MFAPCVRSRTPAPDGSGRLRAPGQGQGRSSGLGSTHTGGAALLASPGTEGGGLDVHVLQPRACLFEVKECGVVLRAPCMFRFADRRESLFYSFWHHIAMFPLLRVESRTKTVG